MTRTKTFFVLALCFAGVLLSAQSNRGSMAGTVKDQTGALIPGATVTIVNAGTNESRSTKTTDIGSFSVPDLDPVVYKVTIEAPGFKKQVVSGVKVDTANVASLNITLETGSVATEITVSASAVTVNTESGTASSTITQQEIRDAPLVDRNVLSLALTLPNVGGDAGTENPAIVAVTTCPGCNLSVNGGRPLSTLMLADGANNTGVSLGRTMASFSPETVQEFTIQTAVFSAEYGGTGGGVINVTTRSGTNDYRGSAVWYNRNPRFSAAPWTTATANRPVSTLKYNQSTFTLGGPVNIPKLYKGRDRTFFFFAFEPNWRRDHLDQYGLLPTDGMRKGDFSGLVNTASGWIPATVAQQFASIAPAAVAPPSTGSDSNIYNNYTLVNGNQFTLTPAPAAGTTYPKFAGNVIPANLLDASALKAIKYIAPAGEYYLNSNGLISNAYLPRILAQDEKRYTIKIDHVFSERDRIFGRYSTSPIVKVQGTPASVTNNGAEYSYAKQAVIDWTHTVTPNQFNDLRLNYTRGRFSVTAAPNYDATTGSDNLNTELGLPSITKGGVPLLNGLFPVSSLGGGGSTSTGLGSGGSTSVEDKEERYAFQDTYYWQKGRMSWKFGVDAGHSLQNVIPLFAALGGSYAFSPIQTSSLGTSTSGGGSPFASFLLGVVNGNVTLRNTEIPYYYRWNNLAAFVQNDWKVRSNLTLNLGVRYNLELPRTEKYNNQGAYDLSQVTTVNLAAPLTLQDGSRVSSAQVPAFVFSGRGNSQYLTPVNYLAFEPRFGFAWTPSILAEKHITFRGGFALSHAAVSGLTRLPNPDFGATSNFASAVPSTTANPSYVMRLGENPPVLSTVSVTQAVGAPDNGVVTTNSLFYQQGVGGYAVSPNFHTPYVMNWTYSVNWQANRNTTVEVAYVGLRGVHLFLPHENVNGKSVSLLTAQINQNVSTTATITDPLGRKNPGTGAALTVQNGSLASNYLGFSSLYVLYDSAANSTRHAGYVNLLHRAGPLTLTANYTYAKSIDDASSAGGDKNVLTPVGGQTDGQVAFGGTRRNDRSVSTFDQRHTINMTAYYQVPFGRGQKFGGNLWKPADYLLGGWGINGISKFVSGFPMMVTLSDSNLLGDLTHTARPDIIPGATLVNPLWSRSCPVGTGCQPYLNPSAFERPALGALGTAPRTLDSVRGPFKQFFDVRIQKKFAVGEKRSLLFLVDFLNIFNHPTFQVFPNNAGGTDLFNNAPTAADPTAGAASSDFNTWAVANNLPGATSVCSSAYSAACNSSISAGDVLFRQVRDSIDAYRPKLQPGQGACTAALAGTGSCLGSLPLNFFNVPLAANFYGTPANNFDIRTIAGYQQYRLRQQLNTGGGVIYESGLPRYIQFGVKFTF